MAKNQAETEIVKCPVGHEYEAVCDDIGSYFCLKCEGTRINLGKPLDTAFKKIDKEMEKMKQQKMDRIQSIFKTLNSCKLDKNQESIIESLERFYNERGYLTTAQEILLDNIYEKASS